MNNYDSNLAISKLVKKSLKNFDHYLLDLKFSKKRGGRGI
jgi:hypothetical protein